MNLSIKKVLLLCFILEGFSSGFLFTSEITDAKIKTFYGDVGVAKKSDGPVEPAVEGMNLIPSSLISTGFHAFCITAVDQDNSFRIKQNTIVQISKLWEESQERNSSVIREVHLNLLQGDILVRLDKMPPNSKLNVQGPAAIAGASGTCFIVSADPKSELTSVTVLDHEVSIESLQDADKVIKLKKFQHVQCAPWAKIFISVMGRGVLPESISSEKNEQKKDQEIIIQALGTGSTLEEAKQKSLAELARIITQLPIDAANNVESLLLEDPMLTEKVYDAVAGAKILDITNNPDATVQVKTELSLTSITEALNRPLLGITQSIIPINLDDYISKFGDPALKVTQGSAETEAYHNLAKIIYRAIVKSGVTIEDLANKDAAVREAVENVVKEAGTTFIEYFSDGSVIVNLTLQGNIIPERLSVVTGNIYGQNYLSAAQLMEFGDYLEYPECQTTVEAYSSPTESGFFPTDPEVLEEEPASAI